MTLKFRDVKTKVNVINVDSKEKYSIVKFRTARNAEDKWINSTFNFVKFVGNAQKDINKLLERMDKLDYFDNGDVKGGVPIFLKSVAIGNESYEKDGKTVYPKNYSITVFAWEFQDENKPQSNNPDKPPVVEEDSDNEELPF
jgi:hypothetical protein